MWPKVGLTSTKVGRIVNKIILFSTFKQDTLLLSLIQLLLLCLVVMDKSTPMTELTDKTYLQTTFLQTGY